MKKFMFIVFCCLIATSFVSLTSSAQSLQSAIDSEYSEVETAAANLWQRSLPLNHLDNPDRIFPGSTLTFAFPDVEDRFNYPVKPGDEGLKISKRLITGDYSFVSKTPKLVETPKITPVKEAVEESTTDWYSGFDSLFFWVLFLIAIFLLVVAIKFYNSWTDAKKNKEWEQNENQNLRNQINRLEDKIKAMEKKMPIEAPALVDQEWLENNHPVNSSVENLNQLVFSGVKELGQKPDLIAKVMVSTAGKSIVMDFSFGRKAQTGLTNVPVYLGWNWDTETNDWKEVGMIATVCSNGFVVSPEKVVPMNELFTKFDLINQEEHPIVYEAELALDVKYPALIRPLVKKFHKNSIADLNKVGAVVFPKQSFELNRSNI